MTVPRLSYHLQGRGSADTVKQIATSSRQSTTSTCSLTSLMSISKRTDVWTTASEELRQPLLPFTAVPVYSG